jgi:hypothetical protein
VTWNDIRLPNEYIEHYRVFGECINCHQPLNHEMHAFNHYKRYHMAGQKQAAPKPVRQQYYVWSAASKSWVETSLMRSLLASNLGIPVAITKPKKVLAKRSRAC